MSTEPLTAASSPEDSGAAHAVLTEVQSYFDLDALSPGAVVLEYGFAWQKAGNGDWFGYMDGCARSFPAITLYRARRGKVEILHEGGWRR